MNLVCLNSTEARWTKSVRNGNLFTQWLIDFLLIVLWSVAGANYGATEVDRTKREYYYRDVGK